MKKSIVKVSTCCLVSAVVIAASATYAGAVGETSASLPVAGVSFSLGTENAMIASEDKVLAFQSVKEETAAPVTKSEFADLAIAQVDDYVYVRTEPSEEAEIAGKLYNNSAATVLGEVDGWYQISSGNCVGYVKSEFVVCNNEELARSVGRRVADVHTETLYVRETPSVDAEVVEMVPEGDRLTVIDESVEGWVGVVVGEKAGYVSAEFVTLDTQFVTAETVEEEQYRLEREAAARQAANAAYAANYNNYNYNYSNNYYANYDAPDYSQYAGAGSGSDIVAYATQFLGNPYVYGGTSLTNGTDCSGFVQSVYGAYGVELSRTSWSQMNEGYGVSYEDAQPGDIIVYSGHVGIYAGNGQIVHASTESTGICMGSADSQEILAVRRIF